jgi:Tol biopolymer transport system component
MLILIKIAIITVVFSITISPLSLQPRQSSGETSFNADNTIGQIPLNLNRDSRNEIYVMNADGTNQTRLTFIEGGNYTPEWLPDGQKIAFLSYQPQENAYEIYSPQSFGGKECYMSTSDADIWEPACKWEDE